MSDASVPVEHVIGYAPTLLPAVASVMQFANPLTLVVTISPPKKPVRVAVGCGMGLPSVVVALSAVTVSGGLGGSTVPFTAACKVISAAPSPFSSTINGEALAIVPSAKVIEATVDVADGIPAKVVDAMVVSPVVSSTSSVNEPAAYPVK